MLRESVNPVMGRALTQAILTALDTAPGGAFLATPKLHLATAGPANVTPDTHVADWTEATFTGYAAFALHLQFSGPVNLDTGLGSGLLGQHTFIATAAPSPSQTIIGYWVDDGASAFYLGEKFASPVNISNNADFLEMIVLFFTAFSVQTN